MSEPEGWSTPQGWGAPSGPPRYGQDAPGQGQPGQPQDGSGSSGQQSYGQQSYGQPQAYGQPQGGPGHYGQPQAGEGQYGPGQYGAPQQAPWGYRPVEVKPGVVPLRPLGLGEVLDGAVGVLRRYPRPALGLAAIIAVVTAIVDIVLLVTAFEPFLTLDEAALERGDTSAIEGALGGAFAGGALGLLLSLLSGAVLTGAITAVVGKAVLGEPLSFGEAWAQVRPRLLPLVGLAVLVLVMVYGVVVLGFAAGIALVALGGGPAAFAAVPLVLAALALAVWLYVRFSLAPCALVLERVGIRASLGRSKVLVARDWWRVFGILLLTVIIGLFVGQVIQLPFAALGAGSPGGIFSASNDVLSTRNLVASAIGSAIASTLVAPFTAGVRALLYVDRRIRAEGLDVSLAAAAAARR